MDCRTAESMVQKYLKHTLTMEELEEFIDHVKECPACYDELETYFTVSTAMQRLDGGLDDKFDSSMDMHHLLELDLKRRENYVRHRKIRSRILLFLLCIVFCVLVMVVLWLFL